MEHRQDYSFIRPVRRAPVEPFIGPVHRIKLAPGIADGAGAMWETASIWRGGWSSERHTYGRRREDGGFTLTETRVGLE